MIFTEARFFLFFLVAFGVHWALRTNRGRKSWLLLCSYAFYGAWDWRFMGLIAFSTVVDYALGGVLAREQGTARRKLWLTLSLVANLGLLGVFKYYDFFATSAAGLLGWLGLEVEARTLNWILPVGISFYTFQTLSYTIDVYRGKLAPVKSFLDFALFVGFFPQLVAGPIVRASHFLPQLTETRLFKSVDVRACLTLFFLGFLKKAVLADNVAVVTDAVFADPDAFTAASNWIALLLWHIQIYGDFSGYSDMAIATAGLLGYHLPKNFDFPYFARNIGEFWQRWHISLSTWFRDYLYISLGGSKGSGARAIWTGCVTMMLCGLWHGAGWQYVGFGVLMSSAIVISRLWSDWVPAGSLPRRAVHAAGPLIMMWFLFVNWIVFRAVSWDTCMQMFSIFFFLDGGGTQTVESAWLLLFAACALVHTALFKGWFRRLGETSDWSYAALYGAAAALCVTFMATDYKPFIYFQF